MKSMYVVIVNPSHGESPVDCLVRKRGKIGLSDVVYSRGRIETSESIYIVLDLKRLDTDKIRGLHIKKVFIYKELKGLVNPDILRWFNVMIRKNNTAIKEIIYI